MSFVGLTDLGADKIDVYTRVISEMLLRCKRHACIFGGFQLVLRQREMQKWTRTGTTQSGFGGLSLRFIHLFHFI